MTRPEGEAHETDALLPPQTRPREASVASSVVRLEDPDDLIVYYSDFQISVRLLRLSLYFFAIVSFCWWLVVTINLFVSVTPVLESPGAGFFEIDLAGLSFIATLTTLYFFPSPATLDILSSYLALLLLFVDLIVVVSVPILRHRHGSNPIGLITLIGSVVLMALNSLAQYIVIDIHYRTREALDEERRLNPRHTHSRVEARKTTWKYRLKSWTNHSLSFIIRLAVTVAVAFISIGVFGAALDQRKFNPPGELVAINNRHYNVHLFCTPLSEEASSSQSPLTVLLESDHGVFGDDFASWVLELQDTGKFDRVCYWDRPGVGYSDSAPSPESPGSVSDILSQAIAGSSYPGINNDTLVLVSHGTGGLYSRVFASHHASQLGTIMLIDAVHEDLFYKSSGFGVGARAFFKGIVWPLQKGRRAKVELQEQLAMGLLRTELQAANEIIPRKTALAVVSSGTRIRKSKDWSEAQRKLTKLTRNNVAWEILDGPHDLWRLDATRTKLQSILTDLLVYSALNEYED